MQKKYQSSHFNQDACVRAINIKQFLSSITSNLSDQETDVNSLKIETLNFDATIPQPI